MPTTLYRPSGLQFCNGPSRWSPTSSDSGDESGETESNDNEVEAEAEDNDCSDTSAPTPAPAPAPAPAARPSTLPRPQFNPRTRLSPLQPLQSKSQSPLARSLLARAVSGSSVAQKPKKTNKLIVPTKSFRTTFELGLSSTELARKA